MNIEKLTEQELLDLKSSIDKKLNKIRQDEINSTNDYIQSMLRKTKLSQLTTNDRIFGIRISGNKGHSLVESTDEISSTWKVDIIDYCKVTEYTDKSRRGGEWHRINISHPTKPFGLGTSLSDEQADKPYILSIDTSKNGYDQFYTLIPETWETDIVEAYNEILEWRKKEYDSDISILYDKLQIYLKEKEKINNQIGKYLQ
jgi:hypothetical protein